jgi:Arc/MetJ-type ribon-helix-helix transcriptional regulator
MKRTNFYFPEEMLARLREAQDRLDLRVSEIIRRAIDEWLERNKERGKTDIDKGMHSLQAGER